MNSKTEVAPVEGRKGVVMRARARVASVVIVTAAFIVGSISPALATPPDTDLTNGSGDTFFSSITSYFTDHVLIAVLALLALMVGAGVLISWGRKAAKAK